MTLHEFPRLGERYWEQRLENGLLLRVVPKPGFARSYAFLGVDYGSVDTSFTRGGIPCRTPDGVAHYLEHKMFDLPEDNAMNLFAAHGGYPNAFTGYAMTAYYFDCTEQFAENLRILLRMVLTPWFPAESVEKERGIIAQEIRMYEDSADSRAYEDLFGAMFAHHPIRVPIAGTVESIGEIILRARKSHALRDGRCRPRAGGGDRPCGIRKRPRGAGPRAGLRPGRGHDLPDKAHGPAYGNRHADVLPRLQM